MINSGKRFLLAFVAVCVACAALAEAPYLLSDGTCGFDTGYRLKSGHSKIELTFSLPSHSGQGQKWLMDTGSGENILRSFWYLTGSPDAKLICGRVEEPSVPGTCNGQVYADIPTGKVFTAVSDLAESVHSIRIKDVQIVKSTFAESKDGSYVRGAATVAGAVSAKPLCVFGTSVGADGKTFKNVPKAKLYGLNIYEDGLIVHKFVPCRVRGVACLKDIISGDVIAPAKAGSFTIHGDYETLTDAKPAAYDIRYPENPKPWELTAVNELKEYLARRTAGRKVTVGGNRSVTFHVGDTPFAAAKGMSSAAMKEEEWTIRSFGGDFILNGGGYRGCLYAVYHFLEDYCGVRWWSETEEDILHSGNLLLPNLNIKGKPALVYRNLMNSNDPKVSTARIAARRRLNRNFELPIPVSLGGGLYVGPPRHTHACMDYIPYEKYGKEHPEYFAVHAKKKPGNEDEFQLCLSNRDVHRLLLECVLASIKKGTADAKAKGLLPPTLYDLTIFDNPYYCECPKCSAEAEKYGRSGLELKMINWIAGEVAKKHPEVMILMAAYIYLEEGPKGGIKAAPNVGIRFSPLGVNFASSILSDDAPNKKTRENILSWRGKTDNLFVWDYAVTFGRDTLGYPFANEWHFGEKYRFYQSCGLRAIEWEQEWPEASDLFDLKHYLLSKLSEKPDLDYPALMRRAFNEFFGPKAGPFVYASRKHLYKVQKKSRPYISFMPDLSHFDFITDEDAALMAGLYDEAEKAVASDARYIRRLKRARLGLDRLMERRRTLFSRGTLDGKRCWMTELPAFGTPHRINALMKKDDTAPLGKAMEFAKKPGHVSPLLVCFYSNVTGKGQFTKEIEIPANTTEYKWFDVGRVTIGQGYHFVMSKSYLGHVYTPQTGEVVGKDFDVKMLAKITDKGQIRIGRMAFIDIDGSKTK